MKSLKFNRNIGIIAAVLVFVLVSIAASNRYKELWNKNYAETTSSVAASATTTHTYPTPNHLEGFSTVSVQLEVTNSSGTTGGTAFVETTNDLDQARWKIQDSLQYLAGSDTILNYSSFANYGIRVRYVNNATTQSTNFFTDWQVNNVNKR